MALSIFSLMGSIFVDSSEAENSIAKTEEKSNKLSESLMNGITTAGQWAAGIATAAAGAALAVGTAAINVSTDVDAAMNGFAASTGTAVDELAQYEDAMLNIYNANYGESFDDIAASMGEIKNIMGDGMGAEELEQMTTNALMLRDTFDMEVSESVRAANALMDQFGITGEEAYNLIAQGAQNGLNQNGDMLDVINEYAVHFESLGYSSEEMFNMLANGAADGTFSIDKLGDAMKEFAIRAQDGSASTTAAFESLGFDAEEMQRRLAGGGDAAQQATNEILTALRQIGDPVEQQAAGVALFGTMWEDLGADAVLAMQDTQGEITNTTDALAAINEIKYDDLGSMMEGLKRNFETLLLPLGNALIPLIMEVVQAVQDNMPVIEGIIASVTPVVVSLFESIIPPLMDLISVVLPPIADLINAVLPAFVSIIEAILPIVTQIIESVLPVLVELIDKLLPPIVEIVNMILPLLAELLPPILDLLDPIIQLLNPIIELLMAILTPLMDLLNVILPPLTEVITILVDVALMKLQTAFQTVSSVIQNVVNVAVTYVRDQIALMQSIFNGIVEFFQNVFAGNWSAAFENLKSIVSDVFEAMINAVKNPVNAIIGIINGLISGVTSGINSVINALNSLNIDVPDWVTEATGVSSFGFNLSTISAPQIPLLAKGGNAIEGGSAIVGEAGAELIELPQGARVTPLTSGGDPLGYKEMTSRLDTMIGLLAGILEKEGVINIGEAQFLNYINKSLGAML